MKIMLVDENVTSIVKTTDMHADLYQWFELFEQALKGMGFHFDGNIDLMREEDD